VRPNRARRRPIPPRDRVWHRAQRQALLSRDPSCSFRVRKSTPLAASCVRLSLRRSLGRPQRLDVVKARLSQHR